MLADDHIAKRSALLQQEDGVRSSALGLTIAGTIATVKPVPLSVVGLSSADFDDLAVRLGANSLGNTTGVSVACKSSGKESCGGSEDLGKLHGEYNLIYEEE